MDLDWQSLAALTVVLLTAAALLRRLARGKRGGCGGGCGGGCHCGVANGRSGPMFGRVQIVKYFTKLRQTRDTKQMLLDAGIVALLIGLGFAVKPAYRMYRGYQVNRNLVAAEAAARQGDWVAARDQARSVLLARQQDFTAFRIWTRALGKLGESRAYLAQVGLFNDPRSTRADRLEALEALAAQGPQALALSAYASLPQEQSGQAAFRVAIAPVLLRHGETEPAETWLRAAAQGPDDSKARLELLRALCTRPGASRVAEARGIFAALIASKADTEALAALLILGETPGGLSADPVLPDLPAWLKQVPQATTRHHLLALHPALAAQPAEADAIFAAAIARFLPGDPAPLGTWLLGHKQAATAARILESPAKERSDAYLVRLQALLSLQQDAELAAALAAPPPGVDLVELEVAKAACAAHSGDASAAAAAWTRAMNQAAFDISRNRFIDLAAQAARMGAPEAAANAWVAAFRLGWGPLPLYRDVLPLYAALFVQGRSQDLLAVTQSMLRFEPYNPELLVNYSYLALIHAVLPPARVIAGLAQVFGPTERPECQGTLMLAEMMDGRAAAALARLPQLAADKTLSVPMRAALEGSARLLAGQTEAASALLKDVAWNRLMRQERGVFADLLAKAKFAGLAQLELLQAPAPKLDVGQAPAWRQAVERLAKDHADETLPALPTPQVPGEEAPWHRHYLDQSPPAAAPPEP